MPELRCARGAGARAPVHTPSALHCKGSSKNDTGHGCRLQLPAISNWRSLLVALLLGDECLGESNVPVKAAVFRNRRKWDTSLRSAPPTTALQAGANGLVRTKKHPDGAHACAGWGSNLHTGAVRVGGAHKHPAGGKVILKGNGSAPGGRGGAGVKRVRLSAVGKNLSSS